MAQSENLTSAVNDLNDHLTSIKDTQYQNLGLKLVEGGFWGWAIVGGVGTLTSSLAAQIQVPGLADNRNTIATGFTSAMADGDVLFVDINRQDNRSNKTTPTTITVQKANIDTFTPTRDRIVFARRVGLFVFIGVNGTIRLANDQAAPLDSALQFLGLNSQSQLPRQLNTTPVNGVNQTISIGTSTVEFQTGGNATDAGGDDVFVDLDLPINSGVLFWEGARFDFAQGIVFNDDGTTFRSRTGGNTTFSFTNLTFFI